MDALSRNYVDFSLALRDESRSGWRQLHRHRDFARYPRHFSIPILGRLSFSTIVSRARQRVSRVRGSRRSSQPSLLRTRPLFPGASWWAAAWASRWI